MGLLDPKLDKKRTFELLRKKGAAQAVLRFYGGHDEGSVQEITLTLENGDSADLPTWYCGGYGLEKNKQGEFDYVPLSVPANEDEELADLLEGPINEAFGSWGGVATTEGTLTWDVASGEAKMSYSHEEWAEHEEEW
jgi:hypothetical protein